LTGFHEVRVLDGHAWVEAWLPPRGWVMLEPTPFYPLPPQQAQDQVASAADRYLDRRAATSALLTPDTFGAAFAQVLRDTWQGLREFEHRFVQTLARLLPWLPLFGLLGALVAAMLRLATLAAVDVRERHALESLLLAARTQSGVAALGFAKAFERALSSRGSARAASETWREYCGRLSGRGVAVPEDFVDAFEDTRYGSEPSAPTPRSAQHLSDAIRDLIRTNPYPRTQRQFHDWRQWLRIALRRR